MPPQRSTRFQNPIKNTLASHTVALVDVFIHCSLFHLLEGCYEIWENRWAKLRICDGFLKDSYPQRELIVITHIESWQVTNALLLLVVYGIYFNDTSLAALLYVFIALLLPQWPRFSGSLPSGWKHQGCRTPPQDTVSSCRFDAAWTRRDYFVARRRHLCLHHCLWPWYLDSVL